MILWTLGLNACPRIEKHNRNADEWICEEGVSCFIYVQGQSALCESANKNASRVHVVKIIKFTVFIFRATAELDRMLDKWEK